ncbi:MULTISPECIES: hypothetical protein [Acinetobacter]|nr:MULTISPECIES: hypothetical protein [Acinetobacter]ENX46660.1 hypothetical protein F943_03001 [Acinetobacter ursingii NIPH 706]EXD35744.1 hypothetical protein J500_1870 [Acinetobacter sp. 479375]
MQNKKANNKFSGMMIFTIVYLVVVFYFAIPDIDHMKTLKPNELGDFFAGFFSPLAFLWLVFGYYQQGEELKQNTLALNLQADELRNSVEQQIKQFEISMQQFSIFKEKEELEIARINQESLPSFQIWIRSFNQHSGYHVTIHNTGAKVKNVLVKYIRSDNHEFNFEYQIFNSEHEESLIMRTIELSKDEPNFIISFSDRLGRKQVSKFKIINSSKSIHKIAFIEID